MAPEASCIAVLLTPPGAAAIAVVRLAGPGVGEFLRRHFDKHVATGRCVHGTLSDAGRVLDDPVIVISADGAVADVSLHGGPWVVRSVLELARREGFDVVETPGAPPPEGAVDGDTPIEREVERYLPLATTDLALRALLAQPAAWAALKRDDAGRVLADRSLYWLLHPPRVAIVGVPNVGKSTLANRLFGAERVITADLPGTTRDWVGEIANLDGLAVMLVDTPGRRPTDDPIERAAIERSGEQVATADLVVLVLDPTQPREPGQYALEQTYPHSLKVMNKSDLPVRWDVFAGVVRTTATTGEGIDALRTAIKQYFLGTDTFDVTRARWWTERQRRVLEDLLSASTSAARCPGT